MDRIDKTLSHYLNITRSEAKALIKNGGVSLNGKTVNVYDLKCFEEDEITVEGKRINNKKFVYIMLNKPKGVVCASEDKREKTVLDLLCEDMKRKNLFPAGRLDKDTTGFTLITDDGEFAHNILSPNKHVEKTYVAFLDKPFDEKVRADFESGMTLGGEKLLSAELYETDGDFKKATVVIRQGIYHQIKRMFKKHGITVLELKRTKIGNLPLDNALKEGEARYITDEELLLIQQ